MRLESRMKSDQTGLGCKSGDSLDRNTGSGLGEAKQRFFSNGRHNLESKLLGLWFFLKTKN